MKNRWLILTAVVLLLSCGNKAKSDLPVTDVEEELGKDIVEKKAESRWGSGFMKNLSRDLKEINPNATCFSETNLLYMKNFYLLYQPYLIITPQLGEQFTQCHGE